MSMFDGSRRDGDAEEMLSIATPTQPWVLPLGIGVAALIGVLVFLQLNANRTRVDAPELTEPSQPPDASADLGADPAPMDPFSFSALPGEAQIPIEQTLAPPSPQIPDVESRLRSPALVVDLSRPSMPGARGVDASAITQAVGGGAAAGRSADEDFASRLVANRGEGSARAERMSNLAYIVPEGTVIPASLETAINSDLPGYVRAVVGRDVRSFDGANVLAPRGSRLVGQYRSGVALGQSRAFVIWTRLIRPDGVSVDLGAPGTDAVGRGGLEGRVDRHFLQRFGGAILLSLISAGTALATEESDTQVIIASTSGAAGSAASVALESDLNIPPTVVVPQGASIRVFVTRDLDFSILKQPE